MKLPWNDQIKIQAALLLKEKIIEQVKKVKEMDKLIEHTRAGVAARAQSKNQSGAVIFMKLIMQYEAQKAQAVAAISELRGLAWKIRYSDTPIDYKKQIKAILDAPVKDMENEDKDDLLHQIQQRLRSLSLQKTAPQAA